MPEAGASSPTDNIHGDVVDILDRSKVDGDARICLEAGHARAGTRLLSKTYRPIDALRRWVTWGGRGAHEGIDTCQRSEPGALNLGLDVHDSPKRARLA